MTHLAPYRVMSNLGWGLCSLSAFLIYWFKYYLRHKYQAHQVRPNQGSNSWPPDHNSTFHGTETPALTTWQSVTSKEMYCYIIFRGLTWFQMHWLSDTVMHWQLIFWFKYDLGQKYQAPQVRPNQGSNSWPSDHNSIFHVTEMPALTTWPSVTSPIISQTQMNYSTIKVHNGGFFTQAGL